MSQVANPAPSPETTAEGRADTMSQSELRAMGLLGIVVAAPLSLVGAVLIGAGGSTQTLGIATALLGFFTNHIGCCFFAESKGWPPDSDMFAAPFLMPVAIVWLLLDELRKDET